MLFVVCLLVYGGRCAVFVGCCLLSAVCRWLLRCVVFVVCCLVFGVWCLLVDVCCVMLIVVSFAVAWSVCVVRCV